MIKRVSIVAAAVLMLVAAFALRGPRNGDVGTDATPTAGESAQVRTGHTGAEPLVATADRSAAQAATAGLPRLVDLGADRCIPCKQMAPILDELSRTYAGIFEVEFIDVWKNPDAAKPWDIQVIPTQVFIDAGGTERFRHQGFISREAILDKWRELGVELPPPSAPGES